MRDTKDTGQVGQLTERSEQQARARRRRQVIRTARLLVAASLAVAAVVKELRTPAEERTWHGDLAGLVPYDLRPPTLERFRERVWAPEDPRVIMPRSFGVGWTLNLGRLVRLARRQRPTG